MSVQSQHEQRQHERRHLYINFEGDNGWQELNYLKAIMGSKNMTDLVGFIMQTEIGYKKNREPRVDVIRRILHNKVTSIEPSFDPGDDYIKKLIKFVEKAAYEAITFAVKGSVQAQLNPYFVSI